MAQTIHARSLRTATELSQYYRRKMIPPLVIISVLQREGIPCVLVGLHGLTGWLREPRATLDVDVVVPLRSHKKAVRVLLAAFPNLVVKAHDVVSRFTEGENSNDVLIDVIKPTEALFRVLFKNTEPVQESDCTYNIPTLEMAIALKFAAMVSPRREDRKKLLDAHDFITMVRANPDFNRAKIAELGELVYAGGGAEITEHARRALAHEKLDL